MFSKFAEDSGYRATGWSWSTVFGRSSLVKAATQHPFGITVLAMSLLLALAMTRVTAMASWASWAPWVVVWGLVCYAASVFAVSRTRPTPNAPELRELEAVRRMIKTKLKERRSSEGWSRSGVTRILEEAHENLEHRIVPAMAELLELQNSLTGMLKEFEDGTLPAPDPQRLDRLRKLHSRRKAIIEESVVQAANAAATLIALLQEHDEATVPGEVEGWAQELLNTYEAIVAVMRPGAEVDPVEDEAKTESEDDGETLSTSTPAANERVRQVYGALELCLRRLNKPGDLARCQLMEMLPNLIEQQYRQSNGGASVEPAPLKLARVLRDVIVEEIEMLRPDGVFNSSDPAAVHYIILREQYIKGRPILQICNMTNVAEASYHRRRREAIEMVTLDLVNKEEMAA